MTAPALEIVSNEERLQLRVTRLERTVARQARENRALLRLIDVLALAIAERAIPKDILRESEPGGHLG